MFILYIVNPLVSLKGECGIPHLKNEESGTTLIRNGGIRIQREWRLRMTSQILSSVITTPSPLWTEGYPENGQWSTYGNPFNKLYRLSETNQIDILPLLLMWNTYTLPIDYVHFTDWIHSVFFFFFL